MFFSSFWLFASVVASSVAATGVVKNPKRGLAFAAGDTPGDLVNANQSDSVITWQYNWASLPPIYLATSVSGLQYIPMQWGPADIQTFADDVATQGADTILVCRLASYYKISLRFHGRPLMNLTSSMSLIWSRRMQHSCGCNTSNLSKPREYA